MQRILPQPAVPDFGIPFCRWLAIGSLSVVDPITIDRKADAENNAATMRAFLDLN